MTAGQFNTLKTTLEEAIDQSSLSMITDAIAEVCQDKAEHAQRAWQDKALAALWSQHGQKFSRLTDKLADTAF
jgi:hypothetical protein